MQEALNCQPVFISNDINHQQIKTFSRPENFKLFYNIHYPILLMPNGQCFFKQCVGREKPRIDNGYMLFCDKSISSTNFKGV